MEYEIVGENLPVLKIKLNHGESIVTEGGAMSWMTPNLKMETVSRGGVGKALGRLFSGEKMFQNTYTCYEGSEGELAIASSFPGSILVVDIDPSREIIAQKSSFLACEEGVDLSVYLQKKLSTGFFGGEGFVMQKLSGKGKAFIEIDGYCQVYELQAGEEIVISTGHLAAMEGSCDMEIRSVEGLKNMFLGGEGIFNTIVTGPGKVYLQGMPISNIAGLIQSYYGTSAD
ncbi:TIGR00266 family protein [Lagierella sp.]|uniref:TIGR00266 family protein n=1 Tax=Lagierella sp. TaxID=2849657 RepID=UPI002625A960|nr:TIGR00266 family protein [Lagierella sp.]